MQDLNNEKQNFRAITFFSDKKSINRFERSDQIDLTPTSSPLFIIIQG